MTWKNNLVGVPSAAAGAAVVRCTLEDGEVIDCTTTMTDKIFSGTLVKVQVMYWCAATGGSVDDVQVQFYSEDTSFEPYRGIEEFIVSTSVPATIPAIDGANYLHAESGEVKVTGREDPRYTVGSLEERIAALEAAIVNNG